MTDRPDIFRLTDVPMLFWQGWCMQATNGPTAEPDEGPTDG